MKTNFLNNPYIWRIVFLYLGLAIGAPSFAADGVKHYTLLWTPLGLEPWAAGLEDDLAFAATEYLGSSEELVYPRVTDDRRINPNRITTVSEFSRALDELVQIIALDPTRSQELTIVLAAHGLRVGVPRRGFKLELSAAEAPVNFSYLLTEIQRSLRPLPTPQRESLRLNILVSSCYAGQCAADSARHPIFRSGMKINVLGLASDNDTSTIPAMLEAIRFAHMAEQHLLDRSIPFCEGCETSFERISRVLTLLPIDFNDSRYGVTQMYPRAIVSGFSERINAAALNDLLSVAATAFFWPRPETVLAAIEFNLRDILRSSRRRQEFQRLLAGPHRGNLTAQYLAHVVLDATGRASLEFLATLLLRRFREASDPQFGARDTIRNHRQNRLLVLHETHRQISAQHAFLAERAELLEQILELEERSLPELRRARLSALFERLDATGVLRLEKCERMALGL